MPTLIDWSTVKNKVESYQQLYDYDLPTLALTHVAIEALFGFSSEDVQESITEGSNDRGIDAVIIEQLVEGDVIHLFQTKYVTEFERASNNFPASEIDKLLSFVDELLQKTATLQRTCNPLLWGKVQEIWDALDRGTPSFVIHLLGNLGPLVSTERERLKSSVKRYRTFSIREHTLEDLAALLLEAREPRLDRQIRLVDNQYFERVDGNIRGLIATVQATDLVEMIRDPRDTESVHRDIFEENVRVYLTSRNRINKRILESALTDTNSEFWYLNNGITMTCEAMEYPPGTRAPLLQMHNVQIVNGGQTSNALFEAAKANPERLRSVLVLIRVYETRQREISLKIAESTNSQTPIRSRDLRANDEIQKKLEESFHSLAYFYERKANQHKEQPKDKRIDALVAAQAHLAYALENPQVAGKERGLIFGELYDTVFNDELTAESLLVALRVFAPIGRMKRQLQEAIHRGSHYDASHLFLIDGAYHLLYAAGLLCTLRGQDRTIPEEALKQLDDAMRVLQEAVKQEEKDPAFALKRFFKSSRAKAYIQDAAKELVERAGSIESRKTSSGPTP